ncbi:hypothetical protein ACFOWZ_31610 [Lentzea rhizosphaerae]|uniref:Uncharacterized protein n=1 Tax=Lentzea rhizosphaerae TaxID=2041025 RepID=A0ABV8C2A4_9PSEU
MTYFKIEPEVAGGWGDEFEIDRTTGTVTRVHYEVADWLGDCVVTSHPVYLVLRDTGRRLTEAGFTGFALDEALVTADEQFHIFNPDGVLPDLVWLKVHGEPGVDDLGLDEGDLVVSEPVMDVIRADGFSSSVTAGSITIEKVTEWPGR